MCRSAANWWRCFIHRKPRQQISTYQMLPGILRLIVRTYAYPGPQEKDFPIPSEVHDATWHRKTCRYWRQCGSWWIHVVPTLWTIHRLMIRLFAYSLNDVMIIDDHYFYHAIIIWQWLMQKTSMDSGGCKLWSGRDDNSKLQICISGSITAQLQQQCPSAVGFHLCKFHYLAEQLCHAVPRSKLQILVYPKTCNLDLQIAQKVIAGKHGDRTYLLWSGRKEQFIFRLKKLGLNIKRNYHQ